MGEGPPFLPALRPPLLLPGPGSVRNYQDLTVLAGWRETWPILLPLPFLAALGQLLRLPHRGVQPQPKSLRTSATRGRTEIHSSQAVDPRPSTAQTQPESG